VAENSEIEWTDHTFNPWIGCTKVGPGCDHCYAEALDKRHRWQGATHWGAGQPRMRTSVSNWRKPLAWNKAREQDGKVHRVFCASLADVFDNEVPETWRMDLLDLIKRTPRLTWLLLTKRIGLASRYLPATPLPNVWIGATIVNQEEADRDVPKLLATPAAIRFVSYEPALGPVDWMKFPGIDWIIVGGESTQGAKARPFNQAWALTTILDAKHMGAAPFVKQLGSGFGFKDRAGADPAEWPEDLRVREFPGFAASTTA
jgi:protein gp37